MRWLILGGGGVFGIHLAKHLLNGTCESVTSVGRNPWPLPPYSLDIGAGDDRFRFHQIHVLHEPERLQKLILDTKPHVIVNFAALAYATSWEDSRRYYETNVVALARLTEWLKDIPLVRFVQIGTSELYGSVTEPVKEDAPLKPTSPYAVSKMAGDLHLLTLTPRGFPAVILRPSNCYGEGQLLYRIMPKAAYCAVRGMKVPLEGGGVVRKSYMHASDLSRAIVTVVEKGEVGQVYNCGPEKPVSIRQVVEEIADAACIPVEGFIEEVEARKNEDACYWLNSDKIKALGWEPRVSLKSGAFGMVRWAMRYAQDLKEPEPFVLRA